MKRLTMSVLAALILAASLPALAGGQVALGENCSVTQDAYGGICPEPPISDGDPDPRLPFTGWEAGAVAGAGVLLLLMGVAMRRSTREPPPPA